MCLYPQVSQHLLPLLQPAGNPPFHFPQLRQNLPGRRILNRLVRGLLVLVDGQIVAVGRDFLLGHEKGPVRACACLFGLQIGEAPQNVGNVVFRHRRSFVVQAEAVGLHVVEPDLVRAAVAGGKALSW